MKIKRFEKACYLNLVTAVPLLGWVEAATMLQPNHRKEEQVAQPLQQIVAQLVEAGAIC